MGRGIAGATASSALVLGTFVDELIAIDSITEPDDRPVLEQFGERPAGHPEAVPTRRTGIPSLPSDAS